MGVDQLSLLEQIYYAFFTLLSELKANGKVENTMTGKYAAIEKNDVKEALGEFYDERIRQFRTLGLIATDPNRLDKSVRVGKRQRRYICIDRKRFDELIVIWNSDERLLG